METEKINQTQVQDRKTKPLVELRVKETAWQKISSGHHHDDGSLSWHYSGRQQQHQQLDSFYLMNLQMGTEQEMRRRFIMS